MSDTILHGFFRSSASWRVRIALALKGISYEAKPIHVVRGDQQSPAYLALNPQGLIPALEIDGLVLTQSLAIIDYLEDTRPNPALLPTDAAARARVRAFALAIACDIHPIQNVKILNRVVSFTGHKEDSTRWAQLTITEGLLACEALLPSDGAFAFGDSPTLADIMLIPQLANARRFGIDLSVMPKILSVEERCKAHPAFRDTAPALQPDYEV